MLSKVYIKVSEFVSNPIVTVNNAPYSYRQEFNSGSLITIKIIATNYQDYVKTLVVPENNILIKINPIDLSSYATKNYLSNQLEGYVTLATDQNITGYKEFVTDKLFNSKWYNLGLRINKAFPNSSAELFKSSCGIYIDDIEGNELGSYYTYHNRDTVNDEFLGSLIRIWNNEDSQYEIFGIQKHKYNDDIKYAAVGSNNVVQSITNWSFPSTDFVDLTAPAQATVTEYVAPGDGYFVLNIQRLTKRYIRLTGVAGFQILFLNDDTTSNAASAFLPLSKGAKFNAYWNATSGSIGLCRFIFANGEYHVNR